MIETSHIKPSKYGLALHTTTPELGLAISNFVDYQRSQTYHLARDLSSHIHYYLKEIIQPYSWTDLEWISVAKGPGGFTGTRLGIVIGRTIAQQLQIPIFTISTLAAVAWRTHRSSYKDISPTLSSSIIAVEMAAQQGKIFGAIYQINHRQIIPLLADKVFTPEEWQKSLEQWHKKHEQIEQVLANTQKQQLAKTVTSVLELAQMEWQQGKQPHWTEALPYYGQHPVDL
ncbi:tRNA (adenosine(37)-N6)-threonylcarbamoyltransferase complex dimerization subunit type 1 TsaB [Anabaena sp. FACHB-1237]|uniref:tRNA (adenosine(37)-N6)-threonylcarbamoyltransferase complex dimerization subunit type 1 TsaB n=1 Tax=Anabaena sp. FACHB-1237 TaxID=2692769 RepID=UPI001681BE71|nr:tRNA (adenosine(37)-N6)-threonylcarbamoyltransferase complex dimerization subunit type 1 TsaB [Anabaena sp. FACHB-1237]MBD2138893.1 tRNA (adenosine(37)-N6)-threonylcarbamoyltransferase complex dimerization subunit type 1 TsaB [Anabaena sp. FACHB-1237]